MATFLQAGRIPDSLPHVHAFWARNKCSSKSNQNQFKIESKSNRNQNQIEIDSTLIQKWIGNSTTGSNNELKHIQGNILKQKEEFKPSSWYVVRTNIRTLLKNDSKQNEIETKLVIWHTLGKARRIWVNMPVWGLLLVSS